jgi:hypothetical protein
MNVTVLKEIEKQVEIVRASRDGCGQVVIKVVRKRIVSIQTQFNFNMEEDLQAVKS